MSEPCERLKAPESRVVELRELISDARRQAAAMDNTAQTLLYWKIGNRIRRNVLGHERAGYGQQIVATMSHELVAELVRGFEVKNLTRMMKFAEAFPDEPILARKDA